MIDPREEQRHTIVGDGNPSNLLELIQRI